MSAGLRTRWTQDEFLAWTGRQEGRYEFTDVSLRACLRGTTCSAFGPDLGLSIAGGAIRSPDALVTCERLDGDERLAPNDWRRAWWPFSRC